MSTKDFSKGVVIPTTTDTVPENFKVLIVRARWNDKIVGSLTEGAKKTLVEAGVAESNVHIELVAGSFELPLAASLLSTKTKYDAIICIGTLIKGETHHYEYICSSTSQGIMDLGLKTQIPVIFGVLMCLTDEQALARAGIGENSHNHGIDWGKTALEMGLLRRKCLDLE